MYGAPTPPSGRHGQLRLDFEITAEDVGATQVVHIKLGNVNVGTYWAHTRHEDTALVNAHQALVNAIKPFVDAAMETDGCEPYRQRCWFCQGYVDEHDEGCTDGRG